jgi:hypothetical protein
MRMRMICGEMTRMRKTWKGFRRSRRRQMFDSFAFRVWSVD